MSAEGSAVKTNLAALRAPPASEAQMPQVSMGFNTLQSFELMQRAAKLLASSTLVPQRYQNNIANCVIALNMSGRLGADPLMVMQNLYVVHGSPGWSAKFLIASFNQCGRFSAVRYKFTGTEGKDDWSCQAYASERETGDVITGPIISIALAKKEGWYQKSGSKWQTIPQLMLMYRAAAWMINTHAPEISMGLQTAEEIHDVYDATRGPTGSFAVDLEGLRDPLPTGGMPPAGAADPSVTVAVNIEAVKKLLQEAASAKDLSEAWDDVKGIFKEANAEIPVEIDGLYNDRKAALESKLL